MIRDSIVRRYKIRISSEVKERAPTARSVNELVRISSEVKARAPTARSVNKLEFGESIAPEQRAVTAVNSISEL